MGVVAESIAMSGDEGSGGGQLRTALSEVVSAQQQLHRMGPIGGHWHHDGAERRKWPRSRLPGSLGSAPVPARQAMMQMNKEAIMQIFPAQRCVAVGVDGSPNSMAALQRAASEAQRRHARLDVIRVVSAGGPWAFRSTASEWLRLRALVAHALPTAQHVTTRLRITHGDPATALIRAARRADLLVIGAGENSKRGNPLGGPTVLSGAPCKVIVCEGAATATTRER
jgi:nucleotide-binding universal stress UspA family protein